MLQNSFGVQLSYASVDSNGGTDPRLETREILSRLRIPAGLRNAVAPWGDQQEAVILVPMTDDGHVLTLTSEDTIQLTMTVPQLRETFADAGLTLWLDIEDASDGEFHAADAVEAARSDEIVDEDIELDPTMFEPTPVRVAMFSHRGPAAARFVAEANRTDVEHIESGVWSLQRFRSADLTNGWISSKAELPVIELNRTETGGDWIEVTTSGGVVPFWLDAERETESVLDLDAITVPETAEICRRLLSEGDGSVDELAEVAAVTRLNVKAAHRALVAESFGGIVGAHERQRVFLAAFGIPNDLIDAALDDETALEVQRFEPIGWPTALRETMIDGMSGMTPLTRRDRPFARLAAGIRRRPMLGAALSVSELTLGLAASRLRGFGRVLGVLMIVDAVVDLIILGVRMRRR